MKKDNLKKYLTIIVVIIGLIAIIYLLPYAKAITTEEGRLFFKDKVKDLGLWGLVILIFMQLLQILLVVLPGEPMEILAGMCYGGFWGTIFIMLTSSIFSTIIFLLVRKYGKNVIYLFFNKDKVNKILDSKIFKNTKKLELVILLLFLIPGTPKDLVVYIGGLLPIKASKFIVISSLARFPSVISGVLAGTNIIAGNWLVSLLVYGITFLLVGITILIINKFDKDKTTNKIFKAFK